MKEYKKMKKIGLIIVLTAFFLMLYFPREALSAKPQFGIVIITGVSGQSINAVTFTYKFLLGFNPKTQSIQVSNSLNFALSVTEHLKNDHTVTVNCGALNPGTAYCRIVEGNNDIIVQISVSPHIWAFLLPL
jgi:hypothetical protein